MLFWERRRRYSDVGSKRARDGFAGAWDAVLVNAEGAATIPELSRMISPRDMFIRDCFSPFLFLGYRPKLIRLVRPTESNYDDFLLGGAKTSHKTVKNCW
jgi:hypothetical protein